MNSTCDESKCVSTGLSHIYNGSHTCYGDGIDIDIDGKYHPMMCADGFLPRLVDETATSTATETSDGGKVDEDSSPSHSVSVPTTVEDGTTQNISVRYFTCCPPPQYSIYSSTNKTKLVDGAQHRRCSDPIWVDLEKSDAKTETFSVDGLCEDDPQGRKYPRRMKPYRSDLDLINGVVGIPTMNNYFICCDSELSSTSTQQMQQLDNHHFTTNTTSVNFLDDTECVPYHNQWYQVAESRNRIGRIHAISCNFPDGDFSVPRPLIHTNNYTTATDRYQCCKTGRPLPPYVKDYAFRINVYIPLALYIIAAIMTSIIATSLLVPFLIERTKKKKSADKRRSSASNSPKYSTYNLYLIFLLLPDVLYTWCFVGIFARIIHQHFNPNFYTMLVWPSGTLKTGYEETYLLTPWVVGNTWMNAIISYQVVELLRASKSVRRINQPSPESVTKMASGVYCLVGLSVIAFHYLETYFFLGRWLLFSLLVSPPCAYIFYAPITICRNGLLPSLNDIRRSSQSNRLRDRAIRELALYFFRIISAYAFTVIPGIFFWMYGYVQSFKAHNGRVGSDWGIFALTVFFLLEIIVSACFVLTKSDVRKYIVDLITLSYLFEKVPDNVSKANNPKPSPRIQTPKGTTPTPDPEGTSHDYNQDISELAGTASRTSRTTSKNSRVASLVPSTVPITSVASAAERDNDGAILRNAAEGTDADDNSDSDGILISSIFGFSRSSNKIAIEQEPQDLITAEDNELNIKDKSDKTNPDDTTPEKLDLSPMVEASEEVVFAKDNQFQFVPESP